MITSSSTSGPTSLLVQHDPLHVMPKLLDQGLLSPVSPQRLGQPCQPKTGSCACDLHSNENKKAQLGQPGQSTHVESIPEYKVQITNIQTKTPRKKNRCNFTLPSLPIQASHRRRQREPLRACFKNQSSSWSKASHAQVGVRFCAPIR